MTKVSVEQRIRRQLAGPSGDGIYQYRGDWNEFSDDYVDRSPHENDEVSRLTLGATSKGFRLSNQSALSVIVLLADLSESERSHMGDVIGDCVTQTHAALIAALIVETGLVRAASVSKSLERAGWLAAELAHALRHQPRGLADEHLDFLHVWASSWARLAAADNSEPSRESLGFEMLIKVIADVQRFRDRAEILRGESPVIDADRRELNDRLRALGLPEDVRDLIRQADRDAEGWRL